MSLFKLIISPEQSIRDIIGISENIYEIFINAGLNTVQKIRDVSYDSIRESVNQLKTVYPYISQNIWSGRTKRCIAIIEKIQQGFWVDEFPTREFSCEICLDWLCYPQRLPNNKLVCQHCIMEWFYISKTNPFTMETLNLEDIVNVPELSKLIISHRNNFNELIVLRKKEINDIYKNF